MFPFYPPGLVDYNSNSNSDQNESFFPTWSWGVLIAAILLILITLCSGICCYCKNNKNKSPSKKRSLDKQETCVEQDSSPPESSCLAVDISCSLCEKSISWESWRNGQHRKRCASRKKDLLASMPTPHKALRCQEGCNKRLRLWPARLGPPFVCSSSDCPVIGKIQSNGTNRFSCFPCDVNLCDSCARRKLRECAPSRRRQRSSQSRSVPPCENKSPELEIPTAPPYVPLNPPYFYPGIQMEEEMLLPSYEQAILNR